jgi:rRNA maturation endonuclease Nob1
MNEPVYLEITNKRTRCLECGCILESDENDFCHNCKGELEMSGPIEMFDFAKEFSYGN